MDPVLLQKQVRDNAEDLRNSLADLKIWESEMKRKESELNSDKHTLLEQSASRTCDLPPIRNKIRKTEKKPKCKEDNKSLETAKISGFDYASWDKFDVDKACQQLDEESEESQEETDSEDQDAESEKLRDEALYEKEKGNQFVKDQKWTNAIECYTRAIECYPYDAVFFANRALCYLKISDLNAAERDCTSALNLDITYVKAFLRRATARMGLGRLEEAKSDLDKVLIFEPKNSVAKADILKIEKKLEVLQTEKKVVIDHEKKVHQTKAKLLMQQAETSINQRAGSSAEPLITTSPVTLNLQEEMAIDISTSHEVKEIQPIHKPPHLRSKKPLKEMKITIINDEKTKRPGDLSQSPMNSKIQEVHTLVSHDLNISKEENISNAPNIKNVETVNVLKVLPTAVQDKEEDASSIPPPANTYIDFYVGWNQVHKSVHRRFLYLKQISAADLPKIFGESLESSVLSELIETLEKSFLPCKEPVYPYLLGISNVKRLSTLALFMNNADKTRLGILLKSCEHSGECTNDDVVLLKKKYEL